jgi:predicted nucleic-acid-binding Zn-ribbon protein
MPTYSPEIKTGIKYNRKYKAGTKYSREKTTSLTCLNKNFWESGIILYHHKRNLCDQKHNVYFVVVCQDI